MKVKYYCETIETIEKAADITAINQSAGTWKKLDSETEELLSKHGAKVISAVKTGEKDSYSLPTRVDKGKKVNCGEFVIEYPEINFGGKISMLLSTVAGEAFDIAEITALKVMDIDFTQSFLSQFKGPKFGLEGSFEICGAKQRPMFGAIIKPCVGLLPSEIAKLAFEAARGGADFIKDDELLADAPYNKLEDRAKAVMGAIFDNEQKTGKKTMYAFNVTDDGTMPLKHHDTVMKYGARAVMFNVMAGGFGMLRELSGHSSVPVHCHRDFSVAAIRSDKIGISSRLFVKLTRLAGGDQIQCGGLGGYLYESDEEMLDNMRACVEPMGHIKPSLPVSSGGMWAGKLKYNLDKIGNNDFMFLCGGGVFGHPDGGYGGIRSLYEAYDEACGVVRDECNGKAEGEYLKKARQAFK